MFLLLSVVEAVVCPYAIRKKVTQSFGIVALLLVCYFIITSFYHMGDTFVVQVSFARLA